eukprot:1503672-Rhodomonas_salina.2
MASRTRSTLARKFASPEMTREIPHAWYNLGRGSGFLGLISGCSGGGRALRNQFRENGFLVQKVLRLRVVAFDFAAYRAVWAVFKLISRSSW